MNNSTWHRTVRGALITSLLLASAHRLPAPIQEVPESPTPRPEQSVRPKPKPKPETSQSSATALPKQQESKKGRFAGTWVGTIPAFPTGPQATVLVVDA